ncbi:MAG: hypothetical protein SOU27_04460 [Sodaliphilus sp.]|nr:hypothetical protein [Sodaliphilus sp.]
MKKILLIVFALLATTTTFGVILDSCEREEIEENDNQEELSIKGDLTGQSVSTFDLNVIGEAMKRMGVAVVNGKIVTNEKSAKQLGISEDLFEQLQLMFAKTNGEKRYGRLRKKVASEFSDVDCVPKLLSSVLKSFGKDISSDAIKAWCKEENFYVDGQGVKYNTLDTIIHKYLDASWATSSTIPYEYRKQSEVKETYLLAVKNNDGSGHFVQVLGAYGTGVNRSYLCYNPQDNGDRVYTEADILSVYSVKGAL